MAGGTARSILVADMAAPENERSDFIRELIARDNEEGTFGGRVQTRFPPEPNGYLHIGHAKAITVDFGLAEDFGGVCNLRFDDTNPVAEEGEYVEGILADLRWLGYDVSEDTARFASDYFPQLYEWAELLIEKGLAYVDEQDGDLISAQRGGYGRPGVESPYRDRPAEESLDLFRRMRDGEFPDGAKVLRARIDMQHENMQMRDPVMYRIRNAEHHRTGDAWKIYPTYDWAHGQSDAIEGVTHSLCTLEFDSHRPLYDWYLDQLPLPYDQPRQTEFARLELTHTVTSKRRLATLVDDGTVDGWDDPRMPTLRGLRTARVSGRVDPGVLRLHRRGPNQQPQPDRAARIVRPHAPERHGPAPAGGAPAAAGRDRQLADRRETASRSSSGSSS